MSDDHDEACLCHDCLEAMMTEAPVNPYRMPTVQGRGSVSMRRVGAQVAERSFTGLDADNR